MVNDWWPPVAERPLAPLGAKRAGHFHYCPAARLTGPFVCQYSDAASARHGRLWAGIPHGHWKTTTFVAGLRLDGIAVPMVLDGPINRNAFQAYVG